jgi:hypothetical protein
MQTCEILRYRYTYIHALYECMRVCSCVSMYVYRYSFSTCIHDMFEDTTTAVRNSGFARSIHDIDLSAWVFLHESPDFPWCMPGFFTVRTRIFHCAYPDFPLLVPRFSSVRSRIFFISARILGPIPPWCIMHALIWRPSVVTLADRRDVPF